MTADELEWQTRRDRINKRLKALKRADRKNCKQDIPH